MASNYNPDATASPVPPLSIAILSQRDLEVEIPIDKIVQPGISITTACFSNGVYVADSARKCFANLLAVGYRRFSLDVYWDQVSRSWTICPVQTLLATSAGVRRAAYDKPALHVRHISNGRVTCTGLLSLESIGAVLVDYLKSTSTNLAARTTILGLNVHAATPSNGSLSRIEAAQLPNGDQELNDALRGLATDLYTPEMLRSQREDLNTSWLGSPESSSPDLTYISTTINSRGDLTTLTGWPNIGLVAFQKRLVVGLGPIDPVMSNYNTTNDRQFYHNTTSVQNLHAVTFDGDNIVQGCLYDPSGTDVALTSQWQVNANLSLAPEQSGQSILPSIVSMTSCGISTFINSTTTSQDISVALHRSVISSSIWSWASNEPRNVSSSEASSDRYRCALQDLSLSGRWRVANCDESHVAACRSSRNPLDWRFSPSRGIYTTRETSCPAGYTFGAPRTALENRYLANAFTQFRASQPSGSDLASEVGAWVDFNALNVQTCWVQGAQTTCPYNSGGAEATRRQVVIPIVASVIVLVIAALLLFVKCAANRRNTRRGRRRRGKEDLGEYDGVPS